MKKTIFASLFAMVLMVPFVVNATEREFSMPKEQTASVETYEGSGVMTYDVEIWLQLDEGDDLTITTLDVTWVPNEEGVELVDYEKSTDFSGTVSGDSVTVTATALSYTLTEGNKVSLGTFTVEYDADASDCGGEFVTEYVKTTITDDTNVQTGINIPLVALGAAGILAVGIYLTISKKNKIYNV